MATENLLFIDIETVSSHPEFSELSPEWQQLWDEKTRWQRGEDTTPEEFYPQRAGILAEFGKVVCASIGFLHGVGTERELRVKSFYEDDEKLLLTGLAEMMTSNFGNHYLCAHNGKEFDFPYLA